MKSPNRYRERRGRSRRARRPAPGSAAWRRTRHRARAAAWLGDRPADPATLAGDSAGTAGLALSRPPAPRKARLDHRRLGHIGEQPARAVLPAHQGRTEAPRARKEDVGAAVGRYRAGPQEGLRCAGIASPLRDAARVVCIVGAGSRARRGAAVPLRSTALPLFIYKRLGKLL